MAVTGKGYGMDTVTECVHANWRWLDCDECVTCELQVCVDCGADINEGEYEFTGPVVAVES